MLSAACTAPIFAVMAYAQNPASFVVTEFDPVTNRFPLMGFANSSVRPAQSFTPTRDGKLQSIRVLLAMNGAIPSSVVFELRPVDPVSGLPTTEILASAAANTSTLSDTAAYFTADFSSSNVVLRGGTVYAFSLRTDSSSAGVGAIAVGDLQSGSDPYPGGAVIRSGDGGNTWNFASPGYYDFGFRVTAVPAVITSTDNTFGAGKLSVDLITGLQWLDLPLTQGKSPEQILGGYGGYIGAGFRFATSAEVQTLWEHFGLTHFNSATVDSRDLAAAQAIVDTLGVTAAGSGFSMTAGHAVHPTLPGLYTQSSVEVDTTPDFCGQLGVSTPCARAIVDINSATAQQVTSYAGAMLVRGPNPIDQAFYPFNFLGGDISGIGYQIGGNLSQSLAQTFTVGRTGQLGRVAVQVGGFGGPTQTVRLDIRPTSNGVPDGNDLSSLASAVIPVARILAASPTNAFITVDLSTPIQVTAGAVLALVLSSDEQVGSYGWQAASSFATPAPPLYTRGAGFFRNHDNPNWRTGGTTDYGFETFVDAGGSADTVAPVLTLPGDISATATAPSGAIVTYSASATDDTDPSPVVSCTPQSGATFPIGVTTVSCSARDAAGNTTGASFQVTVAAPFVPGQVTVDVGTYTGEWAVLGVLRNGNAVVTLPIGTTELKVAGLGAFNVVVAADGTVSVPNGISAVGGYGTLRFNTVDVTIDPGSFAGAWAVDRVGTEVPSGSRVVTLVVGVTHGIRPATGRFEIVIDAGGVVTVSNPASATGGLRTVTFKTMSLTVYQSSYVGEWKFEHITGQLVGGPHTVQFVPGTSGMINIATDSFTFFYANDGTVTIDNGISAIGGSQSMTLNTTTIAVNPQAFSAPWRVDRFTPSNLYQTGPGSIVAVPGVSLSVNAANGFSGFVARVDGNGTVTVQNGVSAVGGLRTLTFNTVRVTADPGGATGTWQLHNISGPLIGAVTETLIPGVQFLITTPFDGSQFFTVTAPCGVSPDHFTLGGYSFTMQCRLDDVAPVITVPGSPVVVEAVSASGATATYTASVTDNIDPSPTLTCTPASGASFPLGSTSVQCSATDSSGNNSTANFIVRVVDTTMPTISGVPVDRNLEAAGPGGAVTTWTSPTATDLVSGTLPVLCAPASGSTFPIGTTIVTCSATDAALNRTPATFRVTVVDTTKPTFTLVSPSRDAVLTSNATVTINAVDVVGVTSVVDQFGTVFTRTSGTAQNGLWQGTVLYPRFYNTTWTYNNIQYRGTQPYYPVVAFTARDAAGNSFGATVIDNDGITSAIDRRRNDFPTDQSGVFSSEFNDGTTSGTIYTNQWFVTASKPSGSNAVRLTVTANAFWQFTPWLTVCGGSEKQVVFHSVGDTADVTCQGTTVTVKAISAVSTIDVWKHFYGSSCYFGSCSYYDYWTKTSLSMGQSVSTGSPLTADANNGTPLHVELIRMSPDAASASGTDPSDIGLPFDPPQLSALDLISETFGTFDLEPGRTVDVSIVPATNGGDDQVQVTALHGTVSVNIAGQVQTITEGQQLTTAAVPRLNQTITFGSIPSKIVGQTFGVTATATSGLAVSFTTSGGCTNSGATITVSGAGTCTVTASQTGNATYNPALSLSQSFTSTYAWSNVLQPVNSDGSSIFKLGSTIPVKFRLIDASAAMTTLAAKIYVAQVSSGVVGTEVEAVSTATADSGNVFRYDSVAGQYIFNLSTKGMTQGTWQVRIDLLDGVSHTALISLKK